ncbi:MAG: hypothetical protein NVSMB4_09980 [Acidimicrobiales bacterium]
MTAPLTANAVAQQLANLGRDLDAAVRSLDVAERDAVNRREDFTLAHARAFLQAEGSVDFRKNTAIVQTHAERVAAETADVVVRGIRRQLDAIKTRIDIGRSVGAAMRSEISLSQTGHQA